MSNSENLFSTLQIPFSQSNHASVFFAHLQNTLSGLPSIPELSMQFSKIDKILFDVFMEHKKLQQDYGKVTVSFKEMMASFSEMMNEFKADRQQLLKVSEDREMLLKRLKQATDGSIELVSENDKLQEIVKKVSELNNLLNEKNQVLEEQMENMKVSNVAFESYQRISNQYERLALSNNEMRKQMLEITQETQRYEIASIPLQLMCLAFQENEKLRDGIWEAVLKNKKEFSDLEYVREKFYNFDYRKMLKK